MGQTLSLLATGSTGDEGFSDNPVEKGSKARGVAPCLMNKQQGNMRESSHKHCEQGEQGEDLQHKSMKLSQKA